MRETPSTRRAVARQALTRRSLIRTGVAVSSASALTWGAGQPAAAATEPAARKPILVGANPGAQLFDADGNCTGYVSCWRVDWSIQGSGEAVVLWRPDKVVAVGNDRNLTLWLAEYFVRHFPELEGLPWTKPEYRRSRAEVSIDLARGATARAGGIEVRYGEVLDRRSFSTDEFPLDGVPHSLHLVLGPVARARISVDGRPVPGQIQLGGTPQRPSSSAFVTEAEVWRR